MNLNKDTNEIPEGYTEIPCTTKDGSKGFAEGSTWYISEIVHERTRLINMARRGNATAKRALMSEPHNISVLVLNKEKII